MSSQPASVLLIDSDQDSRKTNAEFLKSAGFDVVAVGDGDGVATLAARSNAAVVVTELIRGGAIDSVEVMRRLRADRRTRLIPVIVLTANTDDAARALADAAGCDVFLTKPCAPAMLACEIRLLVAERNADPERAGSSKAQATRRTLEAYGEKHGAKPDEG